MFKDDKMTHKKYEKTKLVEKFLNKLSALHKMVKGNYSSMGLSNLDLSDANLQGANLYGANLEEVNFR